MRDTSEAQRRKYFERLASLTPKERARIAGRFTSAVRRLAEAGIRHRHPQATPEEVRIRLTTRLYGRPIARRLFGEIPDDAI